MTDPDDWRLDNPPDWCQDAVLFFTSYKQPSAAWDHDHCSFCHQKIAEPHIPEAMPQAWLFAPKNEWVCPPCFDDLAAYFNWTGVDARMGENHVKQRAPT
ncbi:hypothetical protein [Massilia antarctica]|uniref:hypothetical protein n=1 Tax=Massilia antarctica TaxID=2765360 RepID=UPI0006BB719B|nr:hypothetical protein [Massilia sp. H27-R4]MCY0915944.1 hypothetical protein [Massilia sp. H27-R4]CUI07269.1 hypothetical protein BN2497_9315 [Janthinobacterium sp. CG23_2]CUU31055.1 hypothetical protein BN3177_9315 [Janthinobacterium sp. CG23_2]